MKQKLGENIASCSAAHSTGFYSLHARPCPAPILLLKPPFFSCVEKGMKALSCSITIQFMGRLLLIMSILKDPGRNPFAWIPCICLFIPSLSMYLSQKTTWVLLLKYHTDPNHPPAMWESSKNITRYIFSLYYMHILHNRESIRLYPNVPLFHISTPTKMPFLIMGAMSRARGLFCFLNKFLIFTENILEQEAMESSAFPDNLYCKLIFVKWHTMEIS